MAELKVLDDDMIPKVFISIDAMAKVQQYVTQCGKEVGWMGQVEYRTIEATKQRIITLVNPYAPAQEVTGGTTDLDAAGKGSFAEWAMGLEHPELIKWWGHSHVNMGVSPSGTDMKTFVEHIENDPDEPFVMTIHNKAGAIYSNLYLGGGMYLEDLSVRINYGNDDLIKAVAEELKANVREKPAYVKPNPAVGYNPQYGASNYQSPSYGSGSNRVESSPPASKRGNAESNLMGLRYDRVA